MAKKKIFGWRTGKRKTDGSTEKPSTPLPVENQSAPEEWYKGIINLPLNKFIECLVDSNLSALTISGFPTPTQLHAAWSDIQQEYADAIGSSETKIYMKKWAELVRAQVKLACIEDMIELLHSVYYEPFAQRLDVELRVMLKLDYTQPEDYFKKLKSAHTRSRGLKIALDMMQIQFAAMQEKFKGTGKLPTREYFYSYLYTLSDYAKYEIKDTITVFEFCTRVNRYGKYCEDMEKLHNKK